MASPEPVDPVKRIVAILWSDADRRDEAVRRMEESWGGTDFTGADRPFDVTGYYAPEMGPAVVRRIVAFERLAPPEGLREWKLWTNALESALAADGRRGVNLDVGYLDHSKLVLASAKYAGQKIHLGDGIYADLLGRYKGGRYQPFEWTFPDFRDGRYDAELEAIRAAYLRQLRAGRPR